MERRSVSHFQRMLASWAGILGSILFVAVFLLQDLLAPADQWRRAPVSEYSISPHGWIQALNFVATGALFIVFGRGLVKDLASKARFAAWSVALIGVCLIGSGLFATDQAAPALLGDGTLQGLVHQLLGAVGFTLMPVGAFLFFRYMRKDPARQVLAYWSLAACLIIVIAIVLMKLAQLGVMSDLLGAFQRLALIAYFGWAFTIALNLNSARP